MRFREAGLSEPLRGVVSIMPVYRKWGKRFLRASSVVDPVLPWFHTTALLDDGVLVIAIQGEVMEKDIFKDFKERGRAMEEAYFRQQDAKLIERLHQEAKLEEIAIALAEKLQVDNLELLRRVDRKSVV